MKIQDSHGSRYELKSAPGYSSREDRGYSASCSGKCPMCGRCGDPMMTGLSQFYAGRNYGSR